MVLMLAGISGAVATNMATMMTRSFDYVGSTKIKSESRVVANMIEQSVDCPVTLNFINGSIGAGICSVAPPLNAPGNNLQLTSSSGQPMGTAGSGITAGSYRILGDWWYRAECKNTAAQKGIQVRVGKTNAAGTAWATDPLTGRNLDFSQNSSQVFAYSNLAGAQPLCGDLFLPPDNCANAVGKNLVGGVLTCSKVLENMVEGKSVSTADFANNSVDSLSLRDGTIAGEDVVDSTLSEDRIAATSVNTGIIADTAVTSAKVAAGSIASGQIQDGEITGTKIMDDSINSLKILDGSIGSLQLTDLSVTDTKFQANAVSSPKIVNRSLGTSDVASFEIGNNEVLVGSILSEHIRDGTVVGPTKIAKPSFAAAHVRSNQISSDYIGDLQLDSNHIDDLSILNMHIRNNAISPNKIARNGCADGETFKYSQVGGVNAWRCSSSTTIEFAYCAVGVIGNKPWPIPPGGGGFVFNQPDLSPWENPDPAIYFSLSGSYGECIWRNPSSDAIVTYAADQEDWVGCDESQGWRLVSCQMGDSNNLYSDGIHEMWAKRKMFETDPAAYAANQAIDAPYYPPNAGRGWPADGRKRIFYDRDLEMKRKTMVLGFMFGISRDGNSCVTNDIFQTAAHRGTTMGTGIVAVCARIK
jgi:hypothetical protein